MNTNKLVSRWFACRITSGKQSAKYGIRFSYPLYIFLVALGVFLANLTILSLATIIAFLGVILPMHPFDYVYNAITKLINANKIPGRGTEMQVSSVVSLVFNLLVAASIVFELKLNYPVMAVIYIVSSVFIILMQLSQNTSNKL